MELFWILLCSWGFFTCGLWGFLVNFPKICPFKIWNIFWYFFKFLKSTIQKYYGQKNSQDSNLFCIIYMKSYFSFHGIGLFSWHLSLNSVILHSAPAEQAPAGSRDIPGSRDWSQIPIPGFWKMISRDSLGFIISNRRMISKAFIGFWTKILQKIPGLKC